MTVRSLLAFASFTDIQVSLMMTLVDMMIHNIGIFVETKCSLFVLRYPVPYWFLCLAKITLSAIDFCNIPEDGRSVLSYFGHGKMLSIIADQLFASCSRNWSARHWQITILCSHSLSSCEMFAALTFFHFCKKSFKHSLLQFNIFFEDFLLLNKLVFLSKLSAACSAWPYQELLLVGFVDYNDLWPSCLEFDGIALTRLEICLILQPKSIENFRKSVWYL